MQRTFNYTGRKKILQNEALFSFTDEAETSFNVEFRINEKEYPSNASLYAEAYFKETKQRYSFGKISNIKPPSELKLTEIDLSGTTLFRVLIVDESISNGLLLASGDQFRANKDINDNNNKTNILTLVKKPLGQLAWKVEVETGDAPELCLNSAIPNVMHKMKSDALFQALILPSALKEVLTYYLTNDDESEFSIKWFAFANEFTERETPVDEDIYTIKEYVDEIITEYSEKFKLTDQLNFSFKEDE